MADIPDFPEPSWSTTRQACFTACPRQYYFQYYASWQGWPKGKRESEKESRLAYFWSKRETIPTWTGKLIHDAVARMLRGGNPDLVSKDAMLQLREQWRCSSKRGKMLREKGAEASQAPKTILLMEHAEQELPGEILEEVEEKLNNSLRAFLSLEILGEFREAASAPNRFAFAEDPDAGFSKRVVKLKEKEESEPLEIWAMLDCAYEVSPGVCLIYDWKTGAEPAGRNESQLTEQLLVYALYVMGQERLNKNLDELEIEAFELYLPSCTPFGGAVTASDVADTKERIIAKAQDLQELHYAIKEQGSLACEAKSGEQVCRNCSFRYICEESWLKQQ